MSTTIEIAGRRLPRAAVICPPHESRPDESEWDRSLGHGGCLALDKTRYVPAENGLLFEVHDERGDGTLDLWLLCWACYEHRHNDERTWLPVSVRLIDGDLIPDTERNTQAGVSWWERADPEWVVETIERLSGKPFKVPDGPKVTLKPGDYFDAEDERRAEARRAAS